MKPNDDEKRTKACEACGTPFVMFNGRERVCGPRCASDLARREHVDLRFDTYRKTSSAASAPRRGPAQVPPGAINQALSDTRGAIDLLNGKFGNGAR